MAIYAVSDLHGNYEVFLKGLEKIRFSENDFLWCLGDVVDKGPDGIELLQYIKSKDNMDLIIGNHELMMLNSLDPSGDVICNGRDSDLWIDANDGLRTFKKYKLLSDESRCDLLEWLKTRFVEKTLFINDKKYVLSHSFYNPYCEDKMYKELSYIDVWNITWSSIWRDDYYSHAEDIYSKYDSIFITGHVPVQIIRKYCENEIEWNILKSIKHDNMIIIDGGSAIGRDTDLNNGIIFLNLDDLSEQAVKLLG